MTVIVNLINRYCTVHASDSLLVEEQQDGTYKSYKRIHPKILPIRHFRGALCYFGLARFENGQYLCDWLSQKVESARKFTLPEDFASFLQGELSNRLKVTRKFYEPLKTGIGIHFTAYEWIEEHWIPELFVLSNYSDPSYSSLHSEGILLNRQTYNVIKKCDPLPEHREPVYRLEVHEYLQSGGLLVYNHGDPKLFNPVAQAMFDCIYTTRDNINLSDSKKCRELASIPIRMISDLQRNFFEPKHQKVGGRAHSLSITPTGECSSDTIDCS